MSDLTLILDRLTSVLERLERKLTGESDTGTVEDACNLLKISRRTLNRRMKQWQENVHYWHEGGNLVFDLELLKDWQRNRKDPVAHQRAIDLKQSKLLSNQKKRRS